MDRDDTAHWPPVQTASRELPLSLIVTQDTDIMIPHVSTNTESKFIRHFRLSVRLRVPDQGPWPKKQLPRTWAVPLR